MWLLRTYIPSSVLQTPLGHAARPADLVTCSSTGAQLFIRQVARPCGPGRRVCVCVCDGSQDNKDQGGEKERSVRRHTPDELRRQPKEEADQDARADKLQNEP